MKPIIDEKQQQNRQRVRARDREDHLLGQLTGDRGPAPGGVKTRRTSGTDRRQRTLWSYAYGFLRPRRRGHRRNIDEHRLYVDWHESGLLWLALAILLMSCLDALFTLNLMAVGASEVNLFMRGLIEQDVDRFLTVKIALTGIGLVALVAASRYRLKGRRIVKGAFQVICVLYSVLLGYELVLLSPHLGDIWSLLNGEGFTLDRFLADIR